MGVTEETFVAWSCTEVGGTTCVAGASHVAGIRSPWYFLLFIYFFLFYFFFCFCSLKTTGPPAFFAVKPGK
ncbi:unnamed protein product, partial [Porites lobata]